VTGRLSRFCTLCCNGSVTYRTLFYDSARVLLYSFLGGFGCGIGMEVPVTFLKLAVFASELHNSTPELCSAI
jgi:hypothetical protein